MCIRDRRGGRLYGRGTADDKGAAVVALYCLKALKDERVKCVRKARAIFGAGEEIASDDLKQYFQREALPELAFTPDAEYGVCNREKGILHVELSAPADGSRLESLHGGTVRNAVAASARAEARCTAEECEALEALSKKMDGKFSFQGSDGVLTAECAGRACLLYTSCLCGLIIQHFFRAGNNLPCLVHISDLPVSNQLHGDIA